ncbi:phosphotransferase enzyme family protein [Anoxybacillus amylolyticus]|uniref:Phosphotransferase enzyme family protein n=2 Tax=Anoxybacteroides amylolyticum TaxID=294699 RepID=A0A160F6F5_9BACL|nr:phosphotransferase enzyme family protein [Anoxybacillus amylolyticus]
MMNKQRRDDGWHRLFLFLEKEYGIKVQKCTVIKPHVFLIETSGGKKVLKKYRTFLEASRQQMLFRLLKTEGFLAMPSIEGVIAFSDDYWTIQPYIQAHRSLDYRIEKDREDSLILLRTYHAFSQPLVRHPFFQTMVPRYFLYEKRLERYRQFLHMLPALQRLMKKEELSFVLSCANAFFTYFPSYRSAFFTEQTTMIHGDVASHNFLRTETGSYLIDYDLLAIAPPAVDYLQYISRVMPHVQWSVAFLTQHPMLRTFMEKPWFLAALLFPADVMREWRIVMERNVPFTISHFDNRKRFVQKIMNMIR